jgi:hypothetical protein
LLYSGQRTTELHTRAFAIWLPGFRLLFQHCQSGSWGIALVIANVSANLEPAALGHLREDVARTLLQQALLPWEQTQVFQPRP